MPDISVQFHALPEEVHLFVEDVTRLFDVHIVAIQSRPFEAKEVNAATIRGFIAREPTFRRFAFVLGEPVLPAVNELDFADKNPDHLRLDVGMKTERGLGQSWLSARTDSDKAIGVWKKIAVRLRKETMRGVTAVNQDTGATCNMKSFRYTAGAKLLAEEGTPMLPLAGGSILRFD